MHSIGKKTPQFLEVMADSPLAFVESKKRRWTDGFLLAASLLDKFNGFNGLEIGNSTPRW
jgi:hypothetical protein